MADRLHLLPKHRRVLEALLRKHLPDVEVWAYGSRVNGRSHDGSDLDLVLRGPDLNEIPSGQLGEFEEAVRESNIPFLVEARDWAALPERFHREIEREYVVLMENNRGAFSDKPISAEVDPTLERSCGGSEWAEVALGKLVDVFDGPHATPKKTVTGPIFLGIGNLAVGRLDLEKTEHLSEEDYLKWTRRVTPRPNDVVFSYETRLGEAALIPVGLRVCLGRRMGLLRPKRDAVDARFLLYAFLGPRFQETLRSRTTHGSTVDRIPLVDIANFPIEVPRNLDEQRAIAHILGALDDKIELNRGMSETLEAMARALFKSWFVDFDPVRAKMEGRETGLRRAFADLFPNELVDSAIGQIPKEWPLKALEEVTEINPPRRLRKAEVAPYLDMANMPTNGHTPMSWTERPFGSGVRFVNGDALLARITPCLENGKTAYVDFLEADQVGWGSTEYIVLRPKSPLPSEFGYFLARSDGFREFAVQSMTGSSGRQRVPVQALSQYKLPVPPKAVAESFGHFVRPLVRRASDAARETRVLSALRDTLLPKLISREVRVNQVETETA